MVPGSHYCFVFGSVVSGCLLLRFQPVVPGLGCWDWFSGVHLVLMDCKVWFWFMACGLRLASLGAGTKPLERGFPVR